MDTPSPSNLVRGQTYTNKEWQTLVGGGTYRDFVWHKEGQATSIVANERWNPSVRRGLLPVRAKTYNGRYLQQVMTSGLVVPLGVRVGSNQIEYLGHVRYAETLPEGHPLWAKQRAFCAELIPGRLITHVILVEFVD
jgi:hypothetical protein